MRLFSTLSRWHDRAGELCAGFWNVVLFPPFFLIAAAIQLWCRWDQHRFWLQMNERGQGARWADIEPELANGNGTLVVEIEPKGPNRLAWWIARKRDEVDPEHIVASFADYEQYLGRACDGSRTDRAALDRWSLERLSRFEDSARLIELPRNALGGLPPLVKRDCVLAVSVLSAYRLTARG